MGVSVMLSEQRVKEIVAEVLARLGDAPAPAPPGLSWQNPDAMREMTAATPARIAIGRAGARYETGSWLAFRVDHAAARDAIFHPVSPEFLARLGALVLETRVKERREYLLRPDLGRRLDEPSEGLLH
jgi:ethanolamine ammonia-lyase small subunit